LPNCWVSPGFRRTRCEVLISPALLSVAALFLLWVIISRPFFDGKWLVGRGVFVPGRGGPFGGVRAGAGGLVPCVGLCPVFVSAVALNRSIIVTAIDSSTVPSA
jgi:hypothetical protein